MSLFGTPLVNVAGFFYYPHHANHAHQRCYLPQVDLKAHTTILSTTSRTVLTQKFVNKSPHAIASATYTFPLYDGVSVVGFTCRVGKRLIKGVVKEKNKAKAIYDEAVARGETAGFLQQLPEASDVFSTTIGNIPANETLFVEITYIGELKHDAGVDGIRFTIPGTIAPRYGNLPRAISTHSVQGGKIEITVDVSMDASCKIQSIQSPSHPIAISMGRISREPEDSQEFNPCKAAATLALGSAVLAEDFVLIIKTKDIGTPKALLETHPSIPDQRALMVTLVPKFSLPPSRPELVFIADRSGSMAGRIPTLVSALKVFLKSLPVGVKFNICSFGSGYSFLWPRSKSYDETSLSHAIQHVETFNANMGGTEMFQPIKATIENRYKDMDLDVMLLTDGEIWDQEQIFTYLNAEVGSAKVPIRVFTLGIGNAVSHSLIEGIARAGNGFCQVVTENEKMDSKVVRMLKGGISPHISDYTLELKYQGNTDGESDYEMVERVTDGLCVLLDQPQDSSLNQPQTLKPISLFDPSSVKADEPVSQDDDDQARYSHLPEVPPPKLLQAPHRIPALFPFTRTVIYLLLSPNAIDISPKSVVLRASSTAGPLELEIPVQMLEEPGETFHQLAAKKAVSDLEEGRGWITDAKDQGGVPIKERFEGRWDEIVEREAVRLGVKFQVGGKFCSFVAVEQNDQEIEEKRQKERKLREEKAKKDDQKVILDDADQTKIGSNQQRPPSSSGESSRKDKYQADTDEEKSESGETQDADYFLVDDMSLATESTEVSTGTFTSISSDRGDPSFGAPSQPHAAPVAASAFDRQPALGGAISAPGASLFGGSSPFGRAPSASLFGGTPAYGVQQQASVSVGPAFGSRGRTGGRTGAAPRYPDAAPRFGSGGAQRYSDVAPQSAGSGITRLSVVAPMIESATKSSSRSRKVSGSFFSSSPKPKDSESPCEVKSAGLFSRLRRSSSPDKSGPGSASVPQADAVGFSSVQQPMISPGYPAPQAVPQRARVATNYAAPSSTFAPLSYARLQVVRTKPEELHHIIDLQSFEGSWEISDPLLEVFGVTSAESEQAYQKVGGPSGVSRNVWATALAIAYFKHSLSNYQESWELVVEKALAWLESKIDERIKAALLQEAENLISSSQKAQDDIGQVA
ncbi:MAG: hypothetical protein M1829_005623 [Trizodia sp. TS-e1964]|nr:MAG: hypothetical protein M1829_005623 [Trizodia sp. TS-e1964]